MQTASPVNERTPMSISELHLITGNPLKPPFPENMEIAIFGKGCFWGVEASFWELEGVYTTATGYAGGNVEHPTYREVCSKATGHAEVVLVVYNPSIIKYEKLLERFWKGHRPTQPKKENIIGRSDQYRSVIFTTNDTQVFAANRSLENYQKGLPADQVVTTQIKPAPTFYYAEDKHQQYKAKHSLHYSTSNNSRDKEKNINQR